MVNSKSTTFRDNYAMTGRFNLPFLLLLFYFVIEYAKPAFLADIRPALIIQILLVFYLVGNTEKLTRILQDRFYKLYLLLLVLMALHIFLAENRYWAFVSFVRMVAFFNIGISLCIFVDSYRKLSLLLTFFVFVVFSCVIARILVGWETSGAGLIGTSGSMADENDFALAMNVVLPISIYLGKNEEGLGKWFYWSAAALFTYGVVYSGSRGGFLGLAAVAAACWVYSRHKFRALTVIAIIAAVAWTFASPATKERVSGIGFDSVDKDTGKDRVELWKNGWRAFLANPVIGVGQGNMPIVMEKYQYAAADGESFWKRGLWGRSIHSVYFTLLSELGLAGVLLFGLMLKQFLNTYRRINSLCDNSQPSAASFKAKNLNTALLISVFAFLVSGTFLSAFYYPLFWNVSALIVVLFLRVSEEVIVDNQLVSVT